MQATNPPSKPTARNGPRSSGLTQEKAAAPIQSSNKMPALLIVPCNVIAWLLSHAPVKAPSRFNIGFDVSISALSVRYARTRCNLLLTGQRRGAGAWLGQPRSVADALHCGDLDALLDNQRTLIILG